MLLVLFNLLLTCVNHNTASKNGEYLLKEDLMSQYNNEVRPVLDYNDVLQLKFEVALQQIVEVDEKRESVALSVFFRQYWKDEHLVWNASHYNDVKSTNFDPQRLWVPDVTLYNVLGDVTAGQLNLLKTRLIVNNDGEVNWFSLGLLTGMCSMNIKYFPFDTQVCKFKFGLWSYHGLLVDIQPNRMDVDTNAYTNHSEWALGSAKHVRNVQYYGCCPEPYPDVTVEVVLKRRPLFYVLNLLLPMVLIGFLTLLAFFLPAESGERVSFAVTLLLAMTVFMLIVADMVPASSETIPLLGIFFTCVMIMMVMMVSSMCYILKLYLKTPAEGETIPNWMRRYVYDFLAVKLGYRKREDIAKTTDHNGNTDQERQSLVMKEKQMLLTDIPPASVASNGFTNERAEKLMEKNLHLMTKKMEDEEEERRVKNEFEICANVLDRVALIFFVFMFILITVVYLIATT
uniref:Uncharacterized protein n=1 Tax=Clytia hemisphaerica TaxID=252671 RepID=A0A7M5X2P2_9CNID